MSKTSLLLVSIFLICLGVFFYFNAPSTTPQIQLLKEPRPTVAVSMSSALTLLQEKSYDPQTVQLSVHIDASAQQEKLVQLEIGYDPLVLSIEKITPGLYFTRPTIPLKNINEHIGRISYALTCDQNEQSSPCINKANATVATLTFSVLPQAGLMQSTVALLPKTFMKMTDDTQVAVKRNNITVTFTKQEKVATNAGGIKPLLK